MLRIAYDVVKPILSFHVCTEAEKYFQTPWGQGYQAYFLHSIIFTLFAELSIYCIPTEYHIHIWWNMNVIKKDKYFCKIEDFLNGEIDE